MKYTVIYHRADFDGLFCREIARAFLPPDTEFIGWDYGDLAVRFPTEGRLYILDLSPESVNGILFPSEMERVIWIDHHRTAIEQYDDQQQRMKGVRIDGVAACRLAWQWFRTNSMLFGGLEAGHTSSGVLPCKTEYERRLVVEPLAVRLAGEYDVWDKRDPRADTLQHGLRSLQLTPGHWTQLLDIETSPSAVDRLLARGEAVQYAQQQSNESLIREFGFTFHWEGLTWLACNHGRYNSHLFTAGIEPRHDACFGFNWTGGCWRVSLYGVPGKPHIDLSAIARKYGGGGHKQACGFRTRRLPFAF